MWIRTVLVKLVMRFIVWKSVVLGETDVPLETQAPEPVTCVLVRDLNVIKHYSWLACINEFHYVNS